MQKLAGYIERKKANMDFRIVKSRSTTRRIKKNFIRWSDVKIYRTQGAIAMCMGRNGNQSISFLFSPYFPFLVLLFIFKNVLNTGLLASRISRRHTIQMHTHTHINPQTTNRRNGG